MVEGGLPKSKTPTNTQTHTQTQTQTHTIISFTKLDPMRGKVSNVLIIYMCASSRVRRKLFTTAPAAEDDGQDCV